jgi:hypothetical protein
MKRLSHLRNRDLVICRLKQRRNNLDKVDMSPCLPQCARKNGVLVDLFPVSVGVFPRNSSERQQSQVVAI